VGPHAAAPPSARSCCSCVFQQLRGARAFGRVVRRVLPRSARLCVALALRAAFAAAVWYLVAGLMVHPVRTYREDGLRTVCLLHGHKKGQRWWYTAGQVS
jgi:hypothetical protein